MDPEATSERAPGTDVVASAGPSATPIVSEGDVLARSWLSLMRDRQDPRLDEEFADVPAEPLSVTTAVATILLARCVSAEPRLREELRRGAPVITIEVQAELLVDVEDILHRCALGPSTKLLSGSWLDNEELAKPRQRSAVFIMPSERKWDSNNSRVRRALRLSVPVIGLAPDPERRLPSDLVRSARRKLILPPLGASGLSLVIEAVTGRAPASMVSDAVARFAELSDLLLAIYPDADPDTALAELVRLVGLRIAANEDAPDLAALEGYGRAKEVAMIAAADLAAYRTGKIAWSEMSYVGLLFYGPPGTGKTMLARSIAKAAGVPLVTGSLADFQAAGDGHLGHCLAALRDTAAEARSKAPAILFLDEVDSFGARRDFQHAHRNYSVQVVNALLQVLDGAVARTGVLVVGATNSLADVDEAIRRPGRLDHCCEIPPPGPRGLAAILKFHLGADLPAETSETALAAIAATAGMDATGADAAAWARRARAIARRRVGKLTLSDVEAASREGRPPLADDMRRRVAAHEAGHAVAALAFGHAVDWLSVGTSGGRTVWSEHAVTAQTARRLLEQVVIVLAGRAGELASAGDLAAGSHTDLETATRTLCAMEGTFGLGQSGPVWLGPPQRWSDPEHVAELVARVAPALTELDAQARALVRANAFAHCALTDRLAKSGFLDRAEIEECTANLVRPVPLRVPEAMLPNSEKKTPPIRRRQRRGTGASALGAGHG